MHAGEVRSRQFRVARPFGAAGHQHGVVVAGQVRERHGDADIDTMMEGHALCRHLVGAAVDMLLLHLEIGDAVAQQPARLGLALVDMHIMAHARQLLRCGQAGRSGADDGDALSGLLLGNLRLDPAIVPGLVGDGLLDRLDRDRGVLEVEGAGFLARRGADPPRELGEVVGRVQVARRILPASGIDQIVPVRDLVHHRAAGRTMAVRNAAIHAARRLLLEVMLLQRQRELAEMPHAVASELILLLLPVEFEKTCDLAHCPILTRSYLHCRSINCNQKLHAVLQNDTLVL